MIRALEKLLVASEKNLRDEKPSEGAVGQDITTGDICESVRFALRESSCWTKSRCCSTLVRDVPHELRAVQAVKTVSAEDSLLFRNDFVRARMASKQSMLSAKFQDATIGTNKARG